MALPRMKGVKIATNVENMGNSTTRDQIFELDGKNSVLIVMSLSLLTRRPLVLSSLFQSDPTKVSSLSVPR